MKVKVTQDHIDRGTPGVTMSCPIALAIKDKLFVRHVNVANTRAYVRRLFDIEGTYYALPPSASEFVKLFDNGAKVEPFEFEMYERRKPVEDTYFA